MDVSIFEKRLDTCNISSFIMGWREYIAINSESRLLYIQWCAQKLYMCRDCRCTGRNPLINLVQLFCRKPLKSRPEMPLIWRPNTSLANYLGHSCPCIYIAVRLSCTPRFCLHGPSPYRNCKDHLTPISGLFPLSLSSLKMTLSLTRVLSEPIDGTSLNNK